MVAAPAQAQGRALAQVPDAVPQTVVAQGQPIVPDRWYMGVASHLGDNKGRASDGKMIGEIALTELGATSLRDEAFWDEQDAKEPAFTGKLSVVAQNGGKLLLILDYGNGSDVVFPHTSAERRAFLAYANDAISRIGYQNLAGIEVWNEWDDYMGWGGTYHWGDPCPTDPTDKAGCPVMYSRLVESLLYPEREGLGLPSLRQTAPGVPVIVNAIGARDAAWTTASMNYLRDHDVQVDGAVIHPYVSFPNGCPDTAKAPSGPQTAASCVAVTSDEVARDYGQRLPMWVTEVGWSRGGQNSVSADVQAQYLVEMYVRTRATGDTAGVWWYDLEDDLYASDEVANYGLVGRDPADPVRPGALHPSGQAYSALAHFWAGCTSVDGAYQTNRTFTLPCADGTRQIVLAATADELRAASAAGGTLVDLLGQRADVAAGGDVSSLVGRPVGVVPAGSPVVDAAVPGPAAPGPVAPESTTPESTLPEPAVSEQTAPESAAPEPAGPESAAPEPESTPPESAAPEPAPSASPSVAPSPARTTAAPALARRWWQPFRWFHQVPVRRDTSFTRAAAGRPGFGPDASASQQAPAGSGSDGRWMLVGAGVLLGVGSLLVVVRRRRA